jgi:hypothetical protein
VTNGFRSEWDAKAYAALQSVIATAWPRGENIFDALVKLMGKPINRHPQPTKPSAITNNERIRNEKPEKH